MTNRIIECKKCGGYIEIIYQDKGRIKCPWCGRSFNRKGVRIIEGNRIQKKPLIILQKYFKRSQS